MNQATMQDLGKLVLRIALGLLILSTWLVCTSAWLFFRNVIF